MTEFQQKAVVDAINRMFKGTTFYITTVDDCMKVAGAIRNSDYDALKLYHCVHFDKMDKETRDFVFRATMQNVANCDEFPFVRLVSQSDLMKEQMAIDHAKTPWMKRLFGNAGV
jgi:hypothetical protein